MRPRHPVKIQLLNYSQDRPLDDLLSTHIDNCPECQQKIEELRQEQVDCNNYVRAEDKLEELLERQRQSGSRGLFGSVRWIPAAGVASFLLIVGIVSFVLIKPPTTRLKGSVGVNVYVKRETQVLKADQDFKYRHGDKIRLGIVSPVPVRITVLAEHEEDLSPIPRLTEIVVEPDQERVLPGSLALDCEQGEEILQLLIDEVEGSGVSHTRTIVFTCEQP